MAGKVVEKSYMRKALDGELPCPDCGGEMPNPKNVFDVDERGIPVGRYVCVHCHDAWLALHAGETPAKQLQPRLLV